MYDDLDFLMGSSLRSKEFEMSVAKAKASHTSDPELKQMYERQATQYKKELKEMLERQERYILEREQKEREEAQRIKEEAQRRKEKEQQEREEERRRKEKERQEKDKSQRKQKEYRDKLIFEFPNYADIINITYERILFCINNCIMDDVFFLKNIFSMVEKQIK